MTVGKFMIQAHVGSVTILVKCDKNGGREKDSRTTVYVIVESRLEMFQD